MTVVRGLSVDRVVLIDSQELLNLSIPAMNVPVKRC
jgi:hypothetical protein